MAGKVICPNCGMENTSDAKFCRKCGTSLVAPRRPLTQNNTTNINSSAPKSENKKYAIIGVTVIILVLILCGTAFMILSNQNGAVLGTNGVSTIAGSSQSSPTSSSSSTGSNTQSSESSTSSSSGSWHLVQTFNGVDNKQLTITGLTGSKVKVYAYAMPINNHGGYNHLYTTSTLNGYDAGSTAVDWGTTSAVKGKEDSVVFDGYGDLVINVDTQDLDYWTIKVYSYS